MDIKTLLTLLTAAFGPCGCEDDVRKKITDLIAPYCDDIRSDAMGNLIAHKKGNGARLLFEAHMDTIGVIITHIEESGFLRFGNLGWMSPQDVRRQCVGVEIGVSGVFLPPENKQTAADLKLNDMLIDIAATSKENAETMIQLGDVAVFESSIQFQNGCVFSPYLDNRSGCAALVHAITLLKESDYDLWFVFSTQEEVGLRGIQPAGYFVNPDIGIVIDVTPSNDLPGAANNSSAILSKGPAIKVADSAAICSPAVVKWMQKTAVSAVIPVQRDVMFDGGTDAGGIQKSRSGVYTGGICIPCRYTHAPIEVCNTNDIEQCAKLIVALTESEFIKS